MLTVLPVSTSTAITEVLKLDVSGPLTFEEIDEEWKRILQEYGDDIHHPSEEFRLFSRALSGKRVEGWKGWIADVTPINDEHTLYAVTVYMEEPVLGSLGISRVDLGDLPLEEVQELKMWPDRKDPYGPWQPVVFTGTIRTMTPWGTIYMQQVEIEPEE